MREKASEAFHAEEKDLLQSITALKNAVVVLSKHHKDALIQATMRGYILGLNPPGRDSFIRLVASENDRFKYRPKSRTKPKLCRAVFVQFCHT